jgi:hypothetical protein
MSSHGSISARKHNSNPRKLEKPGDLEAQEAEVWRSVLVYEPLLPAAMDEKYQAREGAAAA